MAPASTNGNKATAPPAGLERRVAKSGHKRAARQDAAHHVALHSNPPAVNNPDGCKAPAVSLFQVGLHDRLLIARRHGMQIEDVRDFDRDRLVSERVTILGHKVNALSPYNPGY